MVLTQEEPSSSPVLPMDVLAESLLRVPAESLVKLKRVSKSWNRVISDSPFAKEHLRRERSRGVLLLDLSAPRHAEMDKISYLPFGATGNIDRAYSYHMSPQDFLPRVGFRVIQSCDGLLLMEPDGPVNGKDRLHICNPVTRSCKVMPTLCEMEDCRWTIGYNPSVQRYKVVGLKLVPTAEQQQLSLCYIFELRGDRQGSGSWKNVDGPQLLRDHSVLEAVVCANGKVHWLFSCCTKEEGIPKSGGLLVSMDLAEEKFSSRELGRLSRPHPTFLRDSYLGSEGVFYLVTSTPDSPFDLLLWTLKDFDNPVWVKRHAFSIESLFPHLPRHWRTVETIQQYKFLESAAFFEDDNKLIMRAGEANFICDMNTNECRGVGADHGVSSHQCRPEYKYYKVYHVNSLISWD